MLGFEQMLLRFAIAIALGGLLGVERELVGKEEAGVRTIALVSGGAALFSMIGLTLPYIVATDPNNFATVVSGNSGYLAVIANIVVGIGFLGGGIIIKINDHPRGVTTAALVWTAAAIGVLAGIGLVTFAIAATVALTAMLYLLRTLNIAERSSGSKASQQ